RGLLCCQPWSVTSSLIVDSSTVTPLHAVEPASASEMRDSTGAGLHSRGALMRPQAQSSVVLVPPAGRSPAILDLTMRNRPETLPPGKPQCCAESVTTLMSPRFGSSRPSNQALADSDHSSSIVAGSSTNSTRPATERQLPASATLILTCGFVRSALAWSPSRARKNQTSASSVTSCAVIGCARILPSASAVASITELLPRRILITSAWPSSFVAAPPAGLFPAPLGAWPPSVSSLAETPPDAEALPVDEPPD